MTDIPLELGVQVIGVSNKHQPNETGLETP